MKTLSLAASLTMLLAGTALAQSGNVVVYNPAGAAGENVIDAFTAKYPGITVSTINAGVGEVFTRLNAEKDRPQADVLICASSEAYMAAPGLFASYESPEAANFSADVIGPDFTYYGCTMPLQAFVVNTRLLPEGQWPLSWEDLGKEEFKGKIVLANPSLSGSAYAQLAQILQLHGWDLAEKIMVNARFVTSSQSVFQDVARGEIEIGVTGEANIGPLIAEGYPVVGIFPSDGTGLRFDASGLVAGGPNPDNGKLFLDFLNSKEAHEIIAATGRRSVRADVPPPEGMTPTAEIVTFPYDAELAASKRDEDLAHWDKLFSK